MAGRYPFNNQGAHDANNPLHNPQLRAALGLGNVNVDEALFLQQRQQEFHRDLHLRQMLLQEQIDQQTRLDSILQEQRLQAMGEHLHEYPDLQHYHNFVLNEQRSTMLREHAQFQQQEEMRRRQQQQQQLGSLVQPLQASHNLPQSAASVASAPPAAALNATGALGVAMSSPGSAAATKPMAAAPAAAGATGSVNAQTTEAPALMPQVGPVQVPGIINAEASHAQFVGDASAQNAPPTPKHNSNGENPDNNAAAQSRKRSESGHSGELEAENAKKQKTETVDLSSYYPPNMDIRHGISATMDLASRSSDQAKVLLDFASSHIPRHGQVLTGGGLGFQPQIIIHQDAKPAAKEKIQGPSITLTELVEATGAVEKLDGAATTLADMKVNVEWEESEQEDDEERDRRLATKKGETINLDGFSSVLPQLPEEPEMKLSEDEEDRGHHILDADRSSAKTDRANGFSKHAKGVGQDSKAPELSIVEYPYQIDTWWPSVATIRKERKANNEPQDEDAFPDDPEFSNPNSLFRPNIRRIREKFATEAEPGVLEKLPHCKVHRMLMKKRKNPTAPELVYCFQVTELYPNDEMVCCSQCGTWRHASCGGHHKPYAVRECIHTPLTVVCDRCHEEEPILREHSKDRVRLDRQRTEQVRRALATSATMRQASFSKHGGAYKWPLGSVSATHIGGHTRSVHSRHDKAEKQWSDMATRLGRGFTGRGKDRTKVRTKELERLLVSVEDAEGHTDRHNMMLFLLQDSLREHPVGFESQRKNIFDPDEDEADYPSAVSSSNSSLQDTNDIMDDASEGLAEEDDGAEENEDHHDDDAASKNSMAESEITGDDNKGPCSRNGCNRRHRFDSAYCSDSCGVSAMEEDLLRTFHCVSDIHPSMFRS